MQKGFLFIFFTAPHNILLWWIPGGGNMTVPSSVIADTSMSQGAFPLTKQQLIRPGSNHAFNHPSAQNHFLTPLCPCSLALMCMATSMAQHQQQDHQSFSISNGLLVLSTERAVDESNLHHLKPLLWKCGKKRASWCSPIHEKAQRLRMNQVSCCGDGNTGQTCNSIPVQQVI